MIGVRPKQTISEAEKLMPEFYKAETDYWIGQAQFSGSMYAEIARLHRAVDGMLDVTDYNYILDPYNTEDEKLKSFPARMRNYNILKPVRDLFLGEQSKKPLNMEVVALNEDAENKMKDNLSLTMWSYIAQDAVNHLNAAGVKTGVETKPVPSYEQVAKQHVENYNDSRAIVGQEALNYIMAFSDFDDKTQRLLNDFLTSGRCFTYKDVFFDDVKYEYVADLDFWCLKSPESPFVEDAVAGVRRFYVLINDLVDRWRDKLSEEDIANLESQSNQLNTPTDPSGFVYLGSAHMDSASSPAVYGRFAGGRIECYHVAAKSLKKVGILTYANELGQTQTTEVDETYVLDTTKGDISIKWEWQSEVRESYRFGTDIYTPSVPTLVQRDELSNTSKCKIPYNGLINGTLTGEVSSVIKDGLIYQVLYNIYHYRREITVNKNKDKFFFMPLGLIPKEFGKDGKDPLDKFMYYLDANSIGFIDETAPNAAAALQALKDVDMGLYQYISGMTEVINSVRNEWWDAVGVNRQRYGDTFASDGKGVNEQAIYRSALISAERNRQFNKLLEKDCNGLLDVSKLAWINGKKGSYINSDGRRAFLNINPQQHLETDYGVFCVNNDQEHEELQALKSAAIQFSQRADVKPSLVANILHAKNFSKVKSIMEKVEELESELKNYQEEANRKSQESIADKHLQAAQLKSDDTHYTADAHYQAAVDAATIAATAKGTTDNNAVVDNSNDMEDIALKREEMLLNFAVQRDKNAIARAKVGNDYELGKEKNQVDRIKARKPSGK